MIIKRPDGPRAVAWKCEYCGTSIADAAEVGRGSTERVGNIQVDGAGDPRMLSVGVFHARCNRRRWNSAVFNWPIHELRSVDDLIAATAFVLDGTWESTGEWSAKVLTPYLEAAGWRDPITEHMEASK